MTALSRLVSHHVKAARVRSYLGHGFGSRRVRVSNEGRVVYYGSIDGLDRQHDYWHLAGQLDELYSDALKYDSYGRLL